MFQILLANIWEINTVNNTGYNICKGTSPLQRSLKCVGPCVNLTWHDGFRLTTKGCVVNSPDRTLAQKINTEEHRLESYFL